MDNWVKIVKFNQIGKDERGETLDFSLPRKQSDFIFVTRKAGSISGNTYHEGKSPATNPKIFLLLQGEIKLSYRHKDHAQLKQDKVSAPCALQIQPFVAIKVEALTDIAMLECNSIADIQDDRVRVEIS